MLGVDMAAEREEDEVGILRPYDLQHRFFPAPRTRIDLSVEFFTSFASIQRAKYVPRPAPGQNSHFGQTSGRRDNNDRNRSRESSRIRENSRMHVCGALVVVL
jgi:hypothetical protein